MAKSIYPASVKAMSGPSSGVSTSIVNQKTKILLNPAIAYGSYSLHFQSVSDLFLSSDTLEQIDISKGLIDRFSNVKFDFVPVDWSLTSPLQVFELVSTAAEAKEAMQSGKIAGWLGVEGYIPFRPLSLCPETDVLSASGHQLGNSLSVLRQYHALGVRYMTLTHACHNAFADSGGIFEPLPPLHHGLSTFGVELVKEMNRYEPRFIMFPFDKRTRVLIESLRLGMLVDLSHTSDETARHTLKVTRAPVIWSHSSARAIHDVARNVPDNILKRIGM